jgi:hypothetical protein
MSSCTHHQMHPEFAKQICAFCAISFSTSFTAFLRLTPDSLHLWIASTLKLTRCSGTACKLLTQVALSLHVSCDMVEFAWLRRALLLSPTSVSTINVTRKQETVARRFFDAYTMAKNLRKISTPFDWSWLDLRYKTKTAQTDTSGQLKDRQLFPSPYATNRLRKCYQGWLRRR